MSSSTTNNNSLQDADSDSDDNDDWIYEQQNNASVEVGASTIKKISQKEKSIYEMIDVLNARLDTLNSTVVEQQELCAEDINPNSELFSHNLKTNDLMDVEMSGNSSKRRQSILFKEVVSGTGSMEDEAKRLKDKFGIPDPATLTWRNPNLPMTDAGKKIEGLFAASLAADARSKGKGAARLLQKKQLERDKENRKEMERRLWAYSENHSGRSATSLIYKLPPGIQDDLSKSMPNPETKTQTLNNTAASKTNNPAILSMTQEMNTLGSNTRFNMQSNKGADPSLEGAGTDWEWPIKLDPTFSVHSLNDMSPKVLLALACEKMALQAGGEHTMKKLCTSRLSSNLFVYFFWFVHCRFFQLNSDVEQVYLLSRVAVIYTQLLSTRQLEQNKDFFFTHYPIILGQAIILGFKYYTPGNQSLFQYDFKKILYLTCARLISGVDVCPESVNKIRQSIFPNDGVEAESKESGNSLPSIILAGAKVDEDDYNPMVTGGGGGIGGILEDADGVVGDTQHNMSSLLFGGVGEGGEREGEGGAHKEDDDEEDGLVRDRVDLLSQDFPKYQFRRGSSGAVESTAIDNKLINTEGRTGKGITMGKSVSMPNFDHAEFPPVQKFTGPRDTLRFRPEKPSFLGKKQLPRQQQIAFNASSISPLLQQYLDHHSDTAGRAPQNLKRTEPVRWCRTGGVDTHVKLPSRRDVHDKLMADYHKAKRSKAREVTKSMSNMVAAVKDVENERMHVLRGGSSAIGKTALEVMKDIEARGPGRHSQQPSSGIPKQDKKYEAVENSVFSRLPLRGAPTDN